MSVARRVHFEDPQQHLADQRESLRARQLDLREKLIAQRMQELAIAEFSKRQREFEELQRREMHYLERVAEHQKERERCLRAYEEQQRRQREIRKHREEVQRFEEQLRQRESSWYTAHAVQDDVSQKTKASQRKKDMHDQRDKATVKSRSRESINKPESIDTSVSANSTRKLLKRHPSQKSDDEISVEAIKHANPEKAKPSNSARQAAAPKLSSRKSAESTRSSSSSSSNSSGSSSSRKRHLGYVIINLKTG